MGRRKTKSKGGKKHQDHVTIFSGSKKAAEETEEIGDEEVTEENGGGDAATNKPANKKGKFKIDQILDKVEEYLDEFNHDMARRFCERALEMDPDNIRALETSGTLLLELDDIENAKQCFGRAISIEPDQGHAKYMYMGQLLTGQDAIASFMRGIDIMTKTLESKPAGASSEGEVTTQDISNAYCSIAEIYLTDECMLEDAEDHCKTILEKAIAADPNNPEAYQLMASFYISKDDKEKARENVEKSVSIWLPTLREADKPDGGEVDPLNLCPVSYPARVNVAKILIEVESYEVASEILELLLDEEDQVVEVWYLLGWLNYLQKEHYLTNARFYLAKAKEVAVKTKFDDQELLSHVDKLIDELGPEPEVEDENDEDFEAEMEEMEAEETSQPDSMEH